MKRILTLLLACTLLFSCFLFTASAAPAIELQYELSIDGKNKAIVQAGDTITVDMYLNNITNDDPYLITTLQNEIEFDKDFFEFTEGDVQILKPASSQLVKYSWGAQRVQFVYVNTNDSGGEYVGVEYANEELIARVTFKVKNGLADGTKGWLKNKVSEAGYEGSYRTSCQDMEVFIGKEMYSLTFETNGGSEIETKKFEVNTTVDLSQYKPTKTGATFAGWYKDSRLTQQITSIKLTEDTTVYAKWTTSGGGTPPGGGGPVGPATPEDKGKEHKAYILGYGDGTFKADNHMSRAEAATIFARLIAEEKGETVSGDATFNDVSSESWYDDYIGYLEKYNIVNGYADGSFRPNNTVTRAEFVVMAVRYYSLFNNVSKGNYTASYPDIQAAHWAYADIAYADNADWINGYADGTFRGNNNITRAEVVTIVNKATNRVPDKEYIDSNISALNKFTDLQKNAHWAYYSIMEAANTHKATTSNGVETWVK